MSSGWASVATAPRDGTPVSLWMIEDETSPEVPLTAGSWTLKSQGWDRLLASLRRSAALLL